MFETVGIRDLRNFASYHFVLRSRILQIPNGCHEGYLSGRHDLPLNLPPTGPLKLLDTKFQYLKAL